MIQCRGKEVIAMVLAVDVGNSTITVGGFCENSLMFVARLSTNPACTEDEYAIRLREILALHGADGSHTEGAIVSSVVPPLTATIKNALHFAFGVEPLVVGPGIKTGLNLRCDDPSSVGADLICACVAGKASYGAPLLIVDLGTATKMMLVDEKGSFAGVSILCGVTTALNALTASASQLPQVNPEAPACVIGKNTADCIRSGAIFGHASMVDGMIDRFCLETKAELKVVATGEHAPRILPHCTHSILNDETLVLKGLSLIYQKNR